MLDEAVTDSYVVLWTDNASSTWSAVPPLCNATSAPAPANSTWGPKRDPLYIVVPITVVYAVILLTGLVGNVSTCIVIARNKHMHTATNYYLFSLAISDLLLLVSGLPQEMYFNWSRYPYVFGEAFCVLQGFAAETSANATVLTITAFTVERYVAICHPFQSHTLSKLSRAVRLVLLIWLVAMGLAVPQALQFGVVFERLADGSVLDEEHSVCTVKRVVIPHSFEVSSLVFFAAPMTLISVLYALIGLQLRRSSLRRGGAGGSVRLKTGVGGGQHHPHHPQAEDGGRKIKATTHVVKMLVAVVVAFFICWAPFHAQRLLAVYATGSTSPSMVLVYQALTYTSGVLYYLSTTVNPVLYHIMSHKFREAFKDTLARFLGRRRGRGGRWQCYTVLSGRHSNAPSCASNCGTTTGSLRRYLEADMARIRGSRRPIVVSFRRHRSQVDGGTADAEVSGGSTSTGAEVYVSLEELTKNNRRKMSKFKKTRNKLNETYLSVLFRHSKLYSKKDHPMPINPSCFLYGASDVQNGALPPVWCNGIPEDVDIKPLEQPLIAAAESKPSQSYPKVEDIEIFQEQHFRIQSSLKKMHRRRRNKIHKPPNASSSSIEYYFQEPREKKKSVGVLCNVPRSSTLPSFGSVERRADAIDQSLKRSSGFDAKCKVEVSAKTSEDSDSVDSNAVSKSEPCVGGDAKLVMEIEPPQEVVALPRYSRPKSCTDLTFSNQTNRDLFLSVSSPRLAL
ncbi:Pyrokinin-1 receptor [Blattella germanica]|nr:Pyrokinin-1 receptor [Blattella germanica]